MFPLRDSERSQTKPFVTIALVVINLLAFFYEVSLDDFSLHQFLSEWGTVPRNFHFVSVLTSMFLHGGWMHVLGNMWFFVDLWRQYRGHPRSRPISALLPPLRYRWRPVACLFQSGLKLAGDRGEWCNFWRDGCLPCQFPPRTHPHSHLLCHLHDHNRSSSTVNDWVLVRRPVILRLRPSGQCLNPAGRHCLVCSRRWFRRWRGAH